MRGRVKNLQPTAYSLHIININMTPVRIRIKDIADLAGVSIGTVDRVLHNRGEVASATRDRIIRIAGDLHYSPNIIAQSLKRQKVYNLVSLLPEATDENIFWKNHVAGIERALSELVPFPVSMTFVNFDYFDESDFRERYREVMNMKPDGVLFAPVFRNGSISFARELEILNVPYVLVDGAIEEAGYLAFTGENARQSGRVAAQLIDMTISPGSEILIVNFAKDLEDTHHLNTRTKGFLEYFSSGSRYCGKGISLTIPRTDFTIVKDELVSVFRNNQGIGAIFVSGSRSHKIARYLCEEGINSVVLGGYDITENNISYLKMGCIKFLIGQRPAEQAFKSVKKLFDYLYFERMPGRNEYLPIDIITSENVDLYVSG